MKKGVRNAFGAFLYVAAVAMFMTVAERTFGQHEPGILGPIGFLMLFVTSAAVMGLLIFGGPVMLYIDGKKKEAVRLVGWTVGALAVITIIVLSTVTLIAV